MRGLKCGVGGKIEQGELAIDAMSREFIEETGLVTTPSQWSMFATLVEEGDDPEWEVSCFRMFSDEIFEAKSMTDERVDVYETGDMTNPEFSSCMLSNVPWLVNLALNDGEGSPTSALIKYPKGSQ